MQRYTSKLATGVGAGVALFLVNNFLLARLLTRLPGGTVLAATDLAFVGFLAPVLPRFPTVAAIYGTYGVLSIVGHLGVDAQVYARHLPMLVATALVYDGIIALGRYRWRGVVVGLLPFATLLLFGQPRPPDASVFLSALLLSGSGLVVGLVARAVVDRLRMRRRKASGLPRD